MIRAVLDSNILVSAMIARGGPPHRIIRAWSEGAFELLVSPKLIAELAGVLARPKFQPQTGEGRAAAYVAAITAGSIWIEDPENPPRTSPDPDDDYLIALAAAGGAEVIVSGDRHLLDLADPPIPVQTARAFAERLED